MNDRDTEEHDESVTDLGAATEVTLGVWAPLHRETFIAPEMRDA